MNIAPGPQVRCVAKCGGTQAAPYRRFLLIPSCGESTRITTRPVSPPTGVLPGLRPLPRTILRPSDRPNGLIYGPARSQAGTGSGDPPVEAGCLAFRWRHLPPDLRPSPRLHELPPRIVTVGADFPILQRMPGFEAQTSGRLVFLKFSLSGGPYNPDCPHDSAIHGAWCSGSTAFKSHFCDSSCSGVCTDCMRLGGLDHLGKIFASMKVDATYSSGEQSKVSLRLTETACRFLPTGLDGLTTCKTDGGVQPFCFEPPLIRRAIHVRRRCRTARGLRGRSQRRSCRDREGSPDDRSRRG